MSSSSFFLRSLVSGTDWQSFTSRVHAVCLRRRWLCLDVEFCDARRRLMLDRAFLSISSPVYLPSSYARKTERRKHSAKHTIPLSCCTQMLFWMRVSVLGLYCLVIEPQQQPSFSLLMLLSIPEKRSAGFASSAKKEARERCTRAEKSDQSVKENTTSTTSFSLLHKTLHRPIARLPVHTTAGRRREGGGTGISICGDKI